MNSDALMQSHIRHLHIHFDGQHRVWHLESDNKTSSNSSDINRGEALKNTNNAGLDEVVNQTPAHLVVGTCASEGGPGNGEVIGRNVL